MHECMHACMWPGCILVKLLNSDLTGGLTRHYRVGSTVVVCAWLGSFGSFLMSSYVLVLSVIDTYDMTLTKTLNVSHFLKLEFSSPMEAALNFLIDIVLHVSFIYTVRMQSFFGQATTISLTVDKTKTRWSSFWNEEKKRVEAIKIQPTSYNIVILLASACLKYFKQKRRAGDFYRKTSSELAFFGLGSLFATISSWTFIPFIFSQLIIYLSYIFTFIVLVRM